MRAVDDIIHQLEANGERLTLQRRAVIEILSMAHDHLTIQEIQVRLQDTRMKLSETTIYRILEWLKDQRLAAQTDIGSRGIVYSLLDTSLHHHLICLSCGRLFDVDDSYFVALRDKLKQELGFTARIDHMAIYGQCATCAAPFQHPTSDPHSL